MPVETLGQREIILHLHYRFFFHNITIKMSPLIQNHGSFHVHHINSLFFLRLYLLHNNKIKCNNKLGF